MIKKNIKLIVILCCLFIIALAYYLINQTSQSDKKLNALPSQFKLGTVNECRKVPQFINQLNMRQPAIDSKQFGHLGGISIRDISNPQHTWQHPSWDQPGFIGGFDRDHLGRIFVAPLPYVSLEKNPPHLQNQLYVIDHNNAQMSLFKKLPAQQQPDKKNPFGTMGLFYDCETNSLYVTTLAGSQPKQQKGAIYQIDLNTNEIVSQLENTDAIGIGIFNTLRGKKLYYGSARKPHIFSVILDEKGHFTDQKKYELSLSDLPSGNTTVAKKISFKKINNKYQMIIKETEFGFRLMAETNPLRKKYHFQYSLSEDKWSYLMVSND